MKILFINHTQQKCGVYQYGKRVSNILVEDKRYKFSYYETDSPENFVEKVGSFNPNVIVYNWHPSTMIWLTPEITHSFKNIKQLYVFHESIFPDILKNDGFIMTDLTEDEKNKKFSLPRPTFNFKKEKKESLLPIFGSFGFGFENKGFEKICEIVNLLYDEAIIRLHITNAFFGDSNGDISKSVIERCKSKITKEKIELQITTNFISDEQILEFLNSNTVNIFLYDNMVERGLSSTIDYAISVDTPLIINSSYMFRHILSDKPEISIENNSIDNIIKMNISPLLHFRKKWSHDSMKDKFYKILQKI